MPSICGFLKEIHCNLTKRGDERGYNRTRRGDDGLFYFSFSGNFHGLLDDTVSGSHFAVRGPQTLSALSSHESSLRHGSMAHLRPLPTRNAGRCRFIWSDYFICSGNWDQTPPSPAHRIGFVIYFRGPLWSLSNHNWPIPPWAKHNDQCSAELHRKTFPSLLRSFQHWCSTVMTADQTERAQMTTKDPI